MISTVFRNNRAAFPAAELAQYEGQWIAFSPDGTKLVAADRDLDALEKLIKGQGFDPSQTVLEFVPDVDYEML